MTQAGPFTYDAWTDIPRQQKSYDCSAASTAWFGRSIGWGWAELDVLWEFQSSGLISPEWGLLDGTGAGIVHWMSLQPVPAHNWQAQWGELLTTAGTKPIIMGGSQFDHWIGVRAADSQGYLYIANPAPGWMNVYTTLNLTQWNELGPFWAIELDT